MSNTTYALFATVFAVIFIVSIVILGDQYSRYAAVAAAFLGCASQFVAQDNDAWKISRAFAYAAFASGAAGLALFMAGV